MAHLTDWMSLAEPNAEWDKYVEENLGGSAPDIGMFPDIPSLRKWIGDSKQAMSAEMGPNVPGLKEQDHQVPMRDGARITCRVYAPQPWFKPSRGSPLVVIFHGGGFCIGGLENEELLCRLLSSKLGAVCVNVDYRLAPEHTFPTGVHDAHDATKWAAANATALGADPTQGFIIGGTSAGGNFAAVVMHLCRDEALKPAITGSILMVPAMVAAEVVPEKFRNDYRSHDQCQNAAILSGKAMKLFGDTYAPDNANPLFSPLLWESGHGGLPATYFQICGQDPLRDEALIFERLLREEEGTKTKVDVYPGLPHGFWSVAPTLEASRQFVDDSVIGVKWLLKAGA